MAKKKVKGVKYWTNKIDKVFHRYIRLRDTDDYGWGQCITCDKSLHFSESQAGHFITRARKSTRWDERNVNLQCARCNCWGNGEQYLYSKKLGQELSDELLELSIETKRFSEQEHEELFKKYDSLCKKAESEKMFL